MTQNIAPQKNQRLLALDVFRGMTIAFMILVNTPGSWSHVFPPLLHASWHGATPTDMVFPFFIFIVGVSMFFSFSKFDQGLTSELTKKIIKRTITIFMIGLLLNYFPFFNRSLDTLRIMGVLQRIALVYGAASLICISVSIQSIWKIGTGILLTYWGLLYWLGGAEPFSLEGNITTAVDLAILGENHIYKGFGIPFDPEGLLSTLPAIVTAMFGYLAGYTVQSFNDKNLLVKNLLLIGTSTVLLALVWDTVFPINKPIWSSSYVLFAGGIACITLALLIEIIDIRGYNRWTKPFIVFGMNPMIIFVFSGVLSKVMVYIITWKDAEGETVRFYRWCYETIYMGAFPNQAKLASLCFAMTVVSICWAFGYVLYRKKIFIKV
ncbi:acyltransferase family protein [Reichenbachiella agariperforans]|nr:hypothetical protein [Reichenbachiella agariperforans]